MIDRQGLAHNPTRIAQGHRGGGQVMLSVDGTGGTWRRDMLDTEFKRRSTTSGTEGEDPAGLWLPNLTSWPLGVVLIRCSVSKARFDAGRSVL
jgi:hypothetical protein